MMKPILLTNCGEVVSPSMECDLLGHTGTWWQANDEERRGKRGGRLLE